jgi:hypothetical protein
MGGSDSAALGFAQGETQMIVMFGQQLRSAVTPAH